MPIKNFILFLLSVTVWFFFKPVSGISQAYDFKSYTVSDGLPHGQIYDLSQSSNGIVWLGTAASGLIRFDGHQYTTYGITKGLKDDVVNVVFVDSNDRLWVSTYNGGVATMVGDSLVYPFAGHELDTMYVTSILEAPDGNIWIGTYYNGPYVIEDEQPVQVPYVNDLIDETIWDIFWDHDGSIWFATHRGLSVWDGTSVRNFDESDGISGSKVFRIFRDRDGLMWMATNRGVTTYDGQTFNAITSIHGNSLGYVFDMSMDPTGRIWIGMENDGIYWFEDRKFTHITRNDGLVSNYIHRLFIDIDGFMWVATDENGISIYRGEGFRFYRQNSGLRSNEILGLHKDRTGNIWIGTNAGLQSFDGNIFTNYDIGFYEYPNKQIWVITELNNGHLLVLLDNSIIAEFDGRRFSNYSEKIGLPELFILDVFVSSSGNVWIATDEGVVRIDQNGWSRLTTRDGLPGIVVHHIFEDTQGRMWFATNLGVAIYDQGKISTIRLQDGLAHYNTNYVTQDSDGDFWIGTSAGVSHYRKDDSNGDVTIKNFGKSDGMRLVESLFLFFDNRGQLWHGTNGGIHRLDVRNYKRTGKMVIEHHRLSRIGIGIEANQDAVLGIDDNTIWFGTMEGIVELKLDQYYNRNSTVPVTHITGVVVNGANILVSPNSRSEKGPTHFSIPSGNHVVTFQFSGIEHINPENLTYRYRLDGHDPDWISTSSQYVTYSNLGAGDYSFIVQSRVGIDPWSSHVAAISFDIKHAYWQSVWFWLIIVVLFLMTTTAIIRFRIHYLEKEKLAKMVDEKTRTLSSALQEKEILLKEVHHRVKNNLSIIYGLLELQMEYLGDDKIKDVFKDSQLRVHSIAMVHEKLYQNDDLSSIDARKYIHELVQVISDAIHDGDKSIQTFIDVDDVTLSLDQGIPCGLILNELISNSYKHAFEHSDAGEIHVSLKRAGDLTVLSVSDNGCGLPDNYTIGSSESLGHILVEALSGQLKSTVNVITQPGLTKFELKFELR